MLLILGIWRHVIRRFPLRYDPLYWGAVFPLGMPYVAGPASIMSIVLLTENDLHSVPQQACTLISLCIVLSITYLVLRAASPLQKLLGGTGINVLGRIMGLVLASLAVQALITGLRNVFFVAH